MKESVTSLYSFDYVAKEAEPSSSVLIQESSESDSEIAKATNQRAIVK